MAFVNKVRAARLANEMKKFQSGERDGIECTPQQEDVYNVLTVRMKGPPDSPYEEGIFNLLVNIPERYPFEPPLIKFTTRVYHPNIDEAGRICLDILKGQRTEQDGTITGWRSTLTLHYTLQLIRLLLAQPNPDDPLVMEIASEYKDKHELYLEKARKCTAMYAV